MYFFLKIDCEQVVSKAKFHADSDSVEYFYLQLRLGSVQSPFLNMAAKMCIFSRCAMNLHKSIACSISKTMFLRSTNAFMACKKLLDVCFL